MHAARERRAEELVVRAVDPELRHARALCRSGSRPRRGAPRRRPAAAYEPRPPAKFTTPTSPSSAATDAATEPQPPADWPASTTRCAIEAGHASRAAASAARRCRARSRVPRGSSPATEQRAVALRPVALRNRHSRGAWAPRRHSPSRRTRGSAPRSGCARRGGGQRLARAAVRKHRRPGTAPIRAAGRR